jgi:ethanolamine ammonia-lyase small subunit
MSLHANFYEQLKNYTPARIALGRAGGSMPTKELLRFQLDHAAAKDAVHAAVDYIPLKKYLEEKQLPFFEVFSQAKDRHIYLRRPDLGRLTDKDAEQKIIALQDKNFDISLVVADGLSATAIDKNITALLDEVIPRLYKQAYKLSPVALVHMGRVAIGDHIGSLFKSRMVIVFIGERPGLSSPDSLGIYLTYAPQKDMTDETRNCISNIRAEGLSPIFAAEKLLYLISSSFQKKLSGILLKDDLHLQMGPPEPEK